MVFLFWLLLFIINIFAQLNIYCISSFFFVSVWGYLYVILISYVIKTSDGTLLFHTCLFCVCVMCVMCVTRDFIYLFIYIFYMCYPVQYIWWHWLQFFILFFKSGVDAQLNTIHHTHISLIIIINNSMT